MTGINHDTNSFAISPGLTTTKVTQICGLINVQQTIYFFTVLAIAHSHVEDEGLLFLRSENRIFWRNNLHHGYSVPIGTLPILGIFLFCPTEVCPLQLVLYRLSILGIVNLVTFWKLRLNASRKVHIELECAVWLQTLTPIGSLLWHWPVELNTLNVFGCRIGCHKAIIHVTFCTNNSLLYAIIGNVASLWLSSHLGCRLCRYIGWCLNVEHAVWQAELVFGGAVAVKIPLIGYETDGRIFEVFLSVCIELVPHELVHRANLILLRIRGIVHMQIGFACVCPKGRINGIWHLLRCFAPCNAWTPNARTILLLFICNLREVELVHLRVWILRLERVGCRNLVNIRLFAVYISARLLLHIRIPCIL